MEPNRRENREGRDLDALLDPAHPDKAAAADWARGWAVPSNDTVDRALWRKCVEAGYTRLMMPADVGGTEDTAVDALLRFEGLGLGAPSLGPVFALISQVIATQRALAAFATDTQRERWLRPLVDGTALGAFTMTEAHGGSAIESIQTLATPDGAGHRITGEKTWATLGPESDVIVVFALTDPAAGRWGLTAFVVDAAKGGVTRHEPEAKLGLHGCPVGRITFDGVKVDESDILGRVGSGAAVFAHAVDAERAFLYAAQLGAMERVLNGSVEWVRGHRIGDLPLGGRQSITHRVVEMHLRHQSARLLLYRAALLHDRGAPVSEPAALAKLAISEGAVESALDAIRLLGARGYGTDRPAGADLLDALGGWFYSGTSEIARNVVASSLRLDRPRRSTSNSKRSAT